MTHSVFDSGSLSRYIEYGIKSLRNAYDLDIL